MQTSAAAAVTSAGTAGAYVLPERHQHGVTTPTIPRAPVAGETWRNHRLPFFLRCALSVSPGAGGCARYSAIVFLFINVSGPFLGMTQLTNSVALGALYGFVFFCSNLAQVCSWPDVGSGLFLGVILEDPAQLNRNAQKQFWGAFIFQTLIFLPVLTYFLIMPMIESNRIGGAAARPWLLAWFVAAAVGSPYLALQSVLMQVPTQVTNSWDQITRNYFQVIRDALIRGDDAPTGATANDRIAEEQERVESWSRSVNAQLNAAQTATLFGCFILSVTTLISLGALPEDSDTRDRVAAISVCVLFCIFMTAFFCVTLYSVARPSLSFERNKQELLNDVRVVDANLKRGWSMSEFNQWLSSHELSSARAFGVRVTPTKMRSVAAFVSTGLGVVLYLLLREELRGLLA